MTFYYLQIAEHKDQRVHLAGLRCLNLDGVSKFIVI